MSTSYYHHTIIDIIKPASIYLEIHSFNIEYFTNITNMNNVMINMLVDVIDSRLLSDGEERDDDDDHDDDDDDDDGGGAIINSRLLSDDLPMSPRVSRRLQPHQ